VYDTGKGIVFQTIELAMVSKEQFWYIIQTYNAQIWPFQLIMYIAAVLLIVWLFLRPGKTHSLFMKIYFAVAFGFTGIGFYMTFGKGMASGSGGNYFLGLIFILISVLFIIAILQKGVLFQPAGSGSRKYLIFILTILTLCYPWMGLLLGHSYRQSIVPGTFPCPTIALCLLVLGTALPRVKKVMNLFLLFCAIPFTILFQVMKYGVYEDILLFVTGIYSLILLVGYWKPRGQPERGSQARK
jgi:hypothetical protein